MLSTLIAACLLAPPTTAPRPEFAPVPVPSAAATRADEEFEKRKTEAGQDVAKLWKLYEWCAETKRDKEGKTILRRIVKLDPEHREANVALGNIFHDGKWFPNQKKIDEYIREKEVAEKTAQGLVEWKGEWVPAADLPYLERGFVRDASGMWVDAEAAKKIAEGWIRQDMDWIPPDEKGNAENGMWKCGDQWLSLADADVYHSEIDTWWRIPGDRFHMYTTVDRDVALQKVKRELDFAYDELVRVYGTKPEQPVIVIVFRDQKQYSEYAGGSQTASRPNTDALGFSSLHHAYYADSAVDPANGAFLNAGAGYWDASSDTGNRWGVHSVRHALGQSFGEALDPSSKVLQRAKKTQMRPEQFWDAFYDEKLVPRWFRYGAATYAERYYRDNTVGIGGDPLWARKWSAKNIADRGGLRQLKQVFDFRLTLDEIPDSEKLINEAGLVVAYAMDGGNAAVGEKLKKFQAAVTARKDKKSVAEAAKALEAEILKNEAELKKFGGM